MASPPDHWKPVVIGALRLCVGGLGYSKGSASELLDGTLKPVTVPLFLPHVCPLGLYLGLAMVVVKGSLLLLEIILILVVIWGNQEDTSRCNFSEQSGSRASKAEEMEKIASPFLRSGR